MKNESTIFLWKKIIISLLLFCLIAGLLSLLSFFIIRKRLNNISYDQNRYHTILNSRYGYADGGFSEQAVDGVCAAFGISKTDCNGSHSLFKNNTIGYGYPQTMENPVLIKKYMDNFIQNENVKNFILTGVTFDEFLCKFNHEYEKKEVNIIGMNTSFKMNDPNCRYSDKRKWPKNLYQIAFDGYYSGYHAGLYVALYALLNPDKFKDYNPSKKGKQIAFAALGGLWIPIIMTYALGFKYGIQKINEKRHELLKTKSDVELVFAKYQDTGGFLPKKVGAKTKAMSKKLYKKDKISVIFIIGVTLTGPVRAAALESNKETKTNHHWLVGAVVDQGNVLFGESNTNWKIKDRVLTSAILKMKEAIAEVIRKKVGKIIPTNNANGKKKNEYSKFSTIPDRFKQTPTIWKKIVDHNLDDLDTVDQGTLPKQIDCAVVYATSGINKTGGKELKKFLNSENDKLSADSALWQKITQGC